MFQRSQGTPGPPPGGCEEAWHWFIEARFRNRLAGRRKEGRWEAGGQDLQTWPKRLQDPASISLRGVDCEKLKEILYIKALS